MTVTVTMTCKHDCDCGCLSDEVITTSVTVTVTIIEIVTVTVTVTVILPRKNRIALHVETYLGKISFVCGLCKFIFLQERHKISVKQSR